MPTLHDALLAWYAREQRDLPWRRTNDPYAIWVSEVMLQQTRVQTVIPYWTRFLGAYPTVHALAEAPLDGVLSLWSGLGYYRRARMLHEGARDVVAAHQGAFPDTVEGLEEIRGIGRYTAGAIASIAFGRAAALVDGNVARVLARIFALEDDLRGAAGMARVWRIAHALVPKQDAGSWNQALMELGATTCTPKSPRCLLCPVQARCDARAQGDQERLPLLAAKAKPKLVERIALVATRGGKVLLGKRHEGGLFGGLWEPPLLDAVCASIAGGGEPEARDGADAGSRFAELVGARLGLLEPLGEVTHVLSHRRLRIHVLGGTFRAFAARSPRTRLGSEYEAFELVAPAAFGGRGLATLARKVLAAGKFEVG
jgi:A/G-specific adenine glycosylase